MSARLPVLFLGHGNPMNALADNSWTRAWARLGKRWPRPRAVLAVSAHWYIAGTAVTAMAAPRTLHDFGGFPPELFAVRYPARGDAALAARVRELLAPLEVSEDHDWGLDHGSWSVLRHLYPAAEVPVVQLSIDGRENAEFHYRLGQQLRPLREEQVLILGSGDIVHNLESYAWGQHPRAPYEWAVRFEGQVRTHLSAGNHDALIRYEQWGADAQLSVPTPEHYLPLLYVLGASESSEPVSFPVEGMDGGSVSMLAVQIGA
jgi:4,5-DOPA dioxygenase extradiol